MKQNHPSAFISEYNFDESAFSDPEVRFLKFDSYSEEWLDYIVSCRASPEKKDNQNIQSDYDIVCGGVANDRIFNTIELYFSHLIDKKEALGRLRFEEPNFQICFKTQETIEKYLHFEESVEL